MLVQLQDVTFGYDGVPVAEHVDFAVHERERVGLLGANGAGKTTLLCLVIGELLPDSGEIFRKNGARIGYLAQNGGFESDATVYGAMCEVFAEDRRLVDALRETERAMATADADGMRVLSARAESLNRRIAARDSYRYDVKIKTVLNGMGFESRYGQPVSTMSGGEKTRLKLCRLLLEEPDLLVLDEPTNHLDLKTLFFLEDYLAAFRGAILVVSHDRFFLDRVTARTLELERGRVRSYKGNYSRYKVLREERYKEELREYERRTAEIEKMRDYVDRNIVRASTAKSALSRVNRLERMEPPEKPLPPPKPPRFAFRTEEAPSERVLEAEKFTLTAGGQVLLKEASFTLARGRKCALTGDNGTGKSTLLKFLAAGERGVRTGRYVRLACYDQENADLPEEERVLDTFRGRCPRLSQTEARSLLAQAGLGAEDVFKTGKELSGGMRAKLGLAMLSAQNANVLLLDEPTNHLDLDARESLEAALRAYEGTLLFVSHDRRFIEAIADEIALIENGTLTLFDGSYADFLAARRDAPPPAAPRPAHEKSAPSEHYRSKEDRAKEAKQKARLKEIETRLEALEADEAALGKELAACAADYREVARVTEKLEAVRAESEALYAEYGTLI